MDESGSFKGAFTFTALEALIPPPFRAPPWTVASSFPRSRSPLPLLRGTPGNPEGQGLPLGYPGSPWNWSRNPLFVQLSHGGTFWRKHLVGAVKQGSSGIGTAPSGVTSATYLRLTFPEGSPFGSLGTTRALFFWAPGLTLGGHITSFFRTIPGVFSTQSSVGRPPGRFAPSRASTLRHTRIFGRTFPPGKTPSRPQSIFSPLGLLTRANFPPLLKTGAPKPGRPL